MIILGESITVMIAAVLPWQEQIFQLQLQFFSPCYAGIKCCNVNPFLYRIVSFQNVTCNNFVPNGSSHPVAGQQHKNGDCLAWIWWRASPCPAGLCGDLWVWGDMTKRSQPELGTSLDPICQLALHHLILGTPPPCPIVPIKPTLAANLP